MTFSTTDAELLFFWTLFFSFFSETQLQLPIVSTKEQLSDFWMPSRECGKIWAVLDQAHCWGPVGPIIEKIGISTIK
jgi:hypothetical protein